MKKKRINEGFRNSKSFINEQDLEDNIKNEMKKEISQSKRK